MANDIIVSEMTSASQINTNDLMIMTQPDLLAETGYSTKKGTVLQVANKMLKGTEYLTDLPDFTDKTVLGGLEELKGDLTALLPVNTASGAIANFDTDLTLPLVDCKANIVASQASGTPTPSSPLPITGYTGMNLTRCGVNLLPETYVRRSGYSTPTATTNNGVITITNYDAGGRFVAYNVKVKVGETYTIKYTNSSNITNIGFLFSDNEPTAWLGFGIVITQNTATTITATKEWLQIYIEASADNATVTNLQIELGSTATAYHAYNGQTYAISFGQTVYGGVLDVTRGKLTVTHANIASYNGESINEPWLSSMDVYVPNTSPTTGAQVVYPLTTPFDIDLTPVQINALLGVNNIFNDTNGDTEVKYKEGIQHYIDKKIAATQALIL